MLGLMCEARSCLLPGAIMLDDSALVSAPLPAGPEGVAGRSDGAT